MINWQKIISAILLVTTVYLTVQAVQTYHVVRISADRLAAYEAKTISLSYGNMTYVDEGNGPTILSIHGMFGGYDQAYDKAANLAASFRVLAPSRFGYLGSDILGEGTPGEQAAAYVELLDDLAIEKVFLLATNAGSSAAIRFALDYPQRTSGLILSGAKMRYAEKPAKYEQYDGLPAGILNNYSIFLVSPFFKPLIGINPDEVNAMMPMDERKSGTILDASINNPDMAKNYEDYPIESLQVPTLILHAKNDTVVPYKNVEKVLSRFPYLTHISFDTGGNTMQNHSAEIENAIKKFIEINSDQPA